MNFPSIRLEGAILTADLLDAIAREDKHSQKPADFGLNPSAKVKDEIASTWASAKALWTGYQAKIGVLREGQTGVSETRNLFVLPLLALLGYQPDKAEAETLNGKSYAISHRDSSRDGFPMHIMGWHDSLEKKRTSGGPRVSSHALVQEYLNLTEHLYGLITNGRQLRLLRDSSRLIKLSFLEFDLIRVFEEDLYADFAILFRLIHATRMPANRANASGSIIEKYHQESVDSGSRIRDGLAAAVAYSMQTVANGLLAHTANASLVDQLRTEPSGADELHQDLLRWVYRTLFVLVIEERVLHHSPAASLRQRQLYRDYYSLQRLRRLADRPQLADRRSHDLWRAMHQTLRLYEDGGKGLPLGIAPLGSFLFREEGLQRLFQYQLDNRSLLQALNRLSTFTHPDTNVRMRVNYGALDVEEFGSVYEALLELGPRIIPDGDKLAFNYAQLAGSERKTSGSYYTPDSLVQCLLDSALDPVIQERLVGKTAKAAEKALLSIKVCDKAVGSGHFLIGAAHRLAHRLAEIRAGEEALSPDVQRHALRDVVSHCLYGVDINPLSVELCKVSLWMLGMEPGKPLGFLDHHIRCGNSLLGTTPELVAEGIPDDAFKVIEGDDSTACAELKKLNRAERKGLGVLFAKEDAAARENLRQAVSAIDEIADDSPEAVRRKEAAFIDTQQNCDFQRARDLANLWCAAFVIRKRFPCGTPGSASLELSTMNSSRRQCVPTVDQPPTLQTGLFGGTEQSPRPKVKKTRTLSRATSEIPIGITTQHLRTFIEGGALPEGLLAESKRLASQYQFFHFHLAFPEVSAQGGFDVSLGNPPWEKVELLQREWFAAVRPDLTSVPAGKEKEALLNELRVADPVMYHAFIDALRVVDGERAFVQRSGRYPLCGQGRINSYAAFAEINLQLLCPTGLVGCVLPPGIATDDSTRFFIQHVVENELLKSFFAFTNRGYIFPAIESTLSFALVTYGKKTTSTLQLAAQLWQIEHLKDEGRVYSLDRQMIRQMNPNTLNLPILQSAKDALLVNDIHRRIPVLQREGEDSQNSRHIEFRQGLFNMTSDKKLFNSLEHLQDDGCKLNGNLFVREKEVFLPLYEAKLTSQFNHRHGTFDGVPATERFGTRAQTNKPVIEKLQNPEWVVLPRFWVAGQTANDAVLEGWGNQWLLGFRNAISAVADSRSVAFAVIPRVGVGNSMPLLFCFGHPHESALLLANFNSFVLDYVGRQKACGGNLNFYVVKQLPILSTVSFAQRCPWGGVSETFRNWLLPRVLELTYTAWDLESFAQDCGWAGPPFRWDEERRFLLRCELDAAFFHLYLGPDTEWRLQPAVLTQAFPTPHHAVDYIMDTFAIVKRKDETKYGDYRTKLVILKIYDELTAAAASGMPYQCKLSPPPADPAVAHPPRGQA